MRYHWFGFVINEEGQPVEDATIKVYLAGTETLAVLYNQETGGSTNNQSSSHILTNGSGYYEFWIADSSESYGYNRDQKFKISWEKTGVTDGTIDYIDVFSIGYNEVDETDGTSPIADDKDKLLSNLLAYTWEQHRLSTMTTGPSASNPHGFILLDEDDFASDSDTGVATQQSIKEYISTTVNPVIENDNVDAPGPVTIDTISATTYDAVNWHYLIKDSSGTAFRSGEIHAHWDNSGVQSPEIQYMHFMLNDVGTFTASFTWDVSLSGGNIVLTISPSVGANFTVKVLRQAL